MASKKKPVSKSQSNPQDDIIIYKVMVALIAGCLAFIGVRLCSARIGYNIVAFYYGSRSVLIVAAIVTVAAAALWIAGRRRALTRRLGLGFFLAGLIVTYGAGLIYFRLDEAFPLLYFTYIAAAVIYCLYLLYQREFFWISVVTSCAGYCFYRMSKTIAAAGIGRLVYALFAGMVILLAAVAVLTFLTRKKGGTLRIGKWIALRFTTPLSALALYLTCAIWLVCLIAVLALGSLFSYCCIFAAVAYELIMACYFTIKLM